MNVVVTLIENGVPLVMKKLSSVPVIGDEIELGKSTSPRRYRVTGRLFRDSMDDWTRVDVYVEEIKPIATKRRK